jgi:subtilisin family serine protease
VGHQDFGGRASWGTNTIDRDDRDVNGHGTHVASTIGGMFYGVAKNVRLIAVKVLSGVDGVGTLASVLEGIAFAVANATDKKKAVLNLSLGGGKSDLENEACNEAVLAGVVMAVAAGNSNADACNYSPSSASGVLSVGATVLDPVDGNEDQEVDTRSSFSNWGSCVKIFAPGTLITAAWIGSSSATRTISGTSMACPHVAGAAAAFWSLTPTATSSQIQAQVLSSTVNNILELKCASADVNCKSSPNKILQTRSCAK